MALLEQNELLKEIKDKNLIVFDGECVLCSGFFRFVIKHDLEKRFVFAVAQSELGEALYRHYDLKAEDYDTNLVILEGVLHERLHAFFEVMKILGWPYKAIVVCKLLPNWLLDWLYYRIARNRYRLFGKREECLVPGPDLRERFIHD